MRKFISQKSASDSKQYGRTTKQFCSSLRGKLALGRGHPNRYSRDGVQNVRDKIGTLCWISHVALVLHAIFSIFFFSSNFTFRGEYVFFNVCSTFGWRVAYVEFAKKYFFTHMTRYRVPCCSDTCRSHFGRVLVVKGDDNRSHLTLQNTFYFSFPSEVRRGIKYAIYWNPVTFSEGKKQWKNETIRYGRSMWQASLHESLLSKIALRKHLHVSKKVFFFSKMRRRLH